MSGRPATSVDVAKRAGVSRATVSHVLNGQTEKFAPETIERVRLAAAELGYVRSAVGRALAMGRSDFVVLAVSSFVDPGSQETIAAASAELAHHGFMSVVHFRVSEAERHESERLQHLVATLRPAGVVDLGGMSRADAERLEAGGWPVVPAPSRPESNGNHTVGVLQAEHLSDRGYERLVYALAPGMRDDSYGEARIAAMAEVCRRRGHPAPVVLDVPQGPVGARDALRALLAASGRRTGVAAVDQVLAESLVRGAQDVGVAVPEALGVVGAGFATEGAAALSLSYVHIDLGASIAYVRRSIAYAYGGAPTEPEPRLDGVFEIVPGRTT